MTETNDWNQSDQQQSTQDTQQIMQQASQQTWVDQQRGGYRGRANRRSNINSYNGRSRGNYQQNGRGNQGKKRNQTINYLKQCMSM